ncbi:class I SAM-dependent methyltransferase [bacterium]|nr:class I SAM-dependent methyltransferase [bacterium]
MSKRDIITFFDRYAPQWDTDLERDEYVIKTILDNAKIDPGVSVLDVASGTGVLVPDYLARGVASVTCVDISPKMIACAKAKFTQPNVRILCGDVESMTFESPFDRIVVYNAFPHFFHPAALIDKLADNLKTGGVLTVAHGMSRAKLQQHHSGSASHVSIELMHEDDLEKLFQPRFTVTTKVSTDRMYQVAGVKK